MQNFDYDIEISGYKDANDNNIKPSDMDKFLNHIVLSKIKKY